MAHVPFVTSGARGRCRLAGTVLAAILLTSPGARADTPQGAFGPLAVRVYDFGGVDRVRLAEALLDARAIFAEAGLASEWHDCTRGAKSSSHICLEPRNASDLIVRIVRRQHGGDGLPAALGVSVVESSPRGGVLATVFLDLIESVANRSGADAPLLIGRAIAHEVGHLVLGTRAHSATGLMREIWTDRELGRNDRHDWLFGPDERTLLRDGRVRLARPTPARPGPFDTRVTEDTAAR
jgi:hypothetical protein